MMGGSGDAEGGREAGGGHGEDPVFGMTSPGAGAALVARKYFDRFGATSEQLAAVAVAFRKHACMDPNAVMQTPNQRRRSPEFAFCVRAAAPVGLLSD